MLQRVNSNVFKDPDGVMENIFGITEYLRGGDRAEGGDLTERPWLILRRRRAVTIFEDWKANRGDARISFPIPCAINR